MPRTMATKREIPNDNRIPCDLLLSPRIIHRKFMCDANARERSSSTIAQHHRLEHFFPSNFITLLLIGYAY